MVAANGSLRAIIHLTHEICNSEGNATWSGAKMQQTWPEHIYVSACVLYISRDVCIRLIQFCYGRADGEHNRPKLRDGVSKTFCSMIDFDGSRFYWCVFCLCFGFVEVPSFRPTDQVEVCNNRRGSENIFRSDTGVENNCLAPTLLRFESFVGGRAFRCH